MIRSVILLVVALALVVAGAAWLSDRPGTVAIEWQGWLIEMSAGSLALIAVMVVVLAVLVAGIVRLIWQLPGSVRNSLRASRRDRGYRTLTRGMVAAAAGEPDEALRLARRANALLDDPPLTMLLSAQAAQLKGEEEAAHNYFLEMLERPDMAFLGLRGLLMQAQRRGDKAAALEYARRAYELQSGSSWVLSTLFDLRVERREWSEALAILDEAARHRVEMPDIGDRMRAAVLLGCSGEAEEAGRQSRARRYSRRAQARVPSFLPAVLRTVELLVRSGSTGRARRMILEAWAETPHPELARVYGEVGTDGDPLKRVLRHEELLAANPEHQESHVALAEAALGAELWGEARNHLGRAAAQDPPARVCRLMAELEERERGDAEKVRSWLLRASSAAPDPAWVCSACGNAWENWAPLCGSCGALGTLDWRPPARALALGSGAVETAADTGAAGANMLPAAQEGGAGQPAPPAVRQPPT